MFDKLLEQVMGVRILEQKEFNDLFHLSPKNLGKVVTFIPRIPSPEMTVGEEDDETPRVSLSSTVEGCLAALPFGFVDEKGEYFETDIFYVYKVVNKPRIHKPTRWQVPDVENTGEVWALSSTRLKLVSKIRSRGELAKIGEDYSDYEILEEY